MLTYRTKAGDVVDDIVFRHYGYAAANPDTLRAVFEANFGLADQPPVLPAGVTINLPDIEQPAQTQDLVGLWD